MITPLNSHYSFENPASIYDEEAMTALELAGRQAAKINEVINDQNELRQKTETTLEEQTNNIREMNDVTMPEKVTSEVQQKIDSGEFDKAIDEYYGGLGRQVKNLLSQTVPGGTTMDAEIIDARMTDAPVAYGTLGEAIRVPVARALGNFSSGVNRLNPAEATKGYYHSYHNGEKVINNDYQTTPFIPCNAMEKWWYFGTAHICIWDNLGNYLRGFVVAQNWLEIDTGEDACYITASYMMSRQHIDMLAQSDNQPLFEPFILTLNNTALDNMQMERKTFVEELMALRYPLPVSWVWGEGLEFSGGFVANTNHQRTDFFSVDKAIRNFTVKALNEKPVWVCGYNADKVKIYSLPEWSIEAVIPNDCAYYVVDQAYEVIQNYRPGAKVSIFFDPLDQMTARDNPHGYKTYETGFIPFTVPVNQTLHNADTVGETVVDVACILSLPAEYSESGEPCKLLMLVHGAGRGVTGAENWPSIDGYKRIVSAFNNAGYAVFDCNGYANNEIGYNHWGCNRAIECYRKAYDYVVRNYNVEKLVNVYGFSMGGLTAFNMVSQGFDHIKCLALGSPVMKLNHAGSPWDGAKSSAYGVNTYDALAVCGNEPTQRIKTIDNTPTIMIGVPPVKIWHGGLEDDTTVAPKSHAQDIVNAIRNGGGRAYYREVADAGHEISYGGNIGVVNEIVAWVNRFNY